MALQQQLQQRRSADTPTRPSASASSPELSRVRALEQKVVEQAAAMDAAQRQLAALEPQLRETANRADASEGAAAQLREVWNCNQSAKTASTRRTGTDTRGAIETGENRRDCTTSGSTPG